MRHVAGVDQRVIFNRFDGCQLIEDYFVARGAVLQAEVDGVDAVVCVQAEAFVAGVVGDRKGGKQLRLCPFELQVLEVQAVVLIEWFFEGFIDGMDILRRDRIDGGVLVHAVDTSLLAVADFLEVVLLLVAVVRDERLVGHDEDALLDVLPEVLGNEGNQSVEFLTVLLCHCNKYIHSSCLLI